MNARRIRSLTSLVLTSAMLMTLLVPVFGVSSKAVANGAATPPEAPIITSVNQGSGNLTLNFTAPEYNGGSAITSYEVQYSLNGSSWTTASNNIDSIQTSYTLHGLSYNTAYYLRLAATNSVGQGAWAYPWELIYKVISPTREAETNLIQYESGFGLGPSDKATRNLDLQFTRIRYKMAATKTTPEWLDADFNMGLTIRALYSENLDSISNLRVPTTGGDSSNQFVIQGNVSDLTVRSNVPGVVSGAGMTGRLELWPYNYNYGPAPGGRLPGRGPSSQYDDSDTPMMAESYGSFQLHALTPTTETLFAWNHHGAPGAAEVGFGNFSGAHSDWTFASQVGGYSEPTSFSLEIYVNAPISTLSRPRPVVQPTLPEPVQVDDAEKPRLVFSFPADRTTPTAKQLKKAKTLLAELTGSTKITCRSYVAPKAQTKVQRTRAAKLARMLCGELLENQNATLLFERNRPVGSAKLPKAKERPLRVEIWLEK